MYSREEFYQGVAVQFKEEFSEYKLELTPSIHNSTELLNFLKDLQPQVQPLIWFIGEFEGIPDCVLGELMHTFRMIYHRKKYSSLHSVVLVGVSTIAELVISSASPFNVVDELKIPYFTFEEVYELIQ
jgi:hypothetical protein